MIIATNSFIHRFAWAFVNGYTQFELEKCSGVLKIDFEAETLTHKPYKDDTIFDFNIAEVEAIMKNNLVDKDGEIYHDIGSFTNDIVNRFLMHDLIPYYLLCLNI